MPPHKKRNQIHIESYSYSKNQIIENGKLYEDEKKIIYNPSIAPFPMEQEKHSIRELGLEKHVHFNPIDTYFLYNKSKKGITYKKGEKKGEKRKKEYKKRHTRRRKIIDSLVLYKRKKNIK